MRDPLAWLTPEAAQRAEAGLHRELVVRPPGPDALLDLASNDYLGLSRHPAVVEAGCAALRDHGAGATGSRLVTGTTSAHAELEQALAARTGQPAALVLSSGYLANLAAVTALVRPGTTVVSDAANHASLVDACRLAGGTRVVVPHRDVDAVRAALADAPGPAVVITDALFSVDGDLAPLTALHTACRARGALLLVDEAHTLGTTGPAGAGAVAAAGLAGAPDVVLTATLSKALGSQGGAVLGPAVLRAHLVDTARAFVFDTGLAPAAAGAARAALALVDDARVQALRARALALAGALGLPFPDGPVLRVPLGEPGRALAAQQHCAAEGVRVGCFRPPSVPAGGSCLRLTVRADLSAADVERAAAVVRRAAEAVGRPLGRVLQSGGEVPTTGR